MTEPISFTVADIPPVGNPDDDANPLGSDDPTCQVCGTPLTYGGRGRKPKFCDDHKPSRSSSSTTTRRSTGRDVDAAMAALDSAHTSLSFVLMLVAGDAALLWEAERDALNARNQRILEADPKLAKRLATAASKGGGPALVLSHLVAIAPAAGIAYANVRVARDSKARERSQAKPQNVDNVVDMTMTKPSPVVDPDVAFRR